MIEPPPWWGSGVGSYAWWIETAAWSGAVLGSDVWLTAVLDDAANDWGYLN